MKTLLVMCPQWTISQPPLGIAYLKSYVENAKCLDLNIKFYHKIKDKEILNDSSLWENKELFDKILAEHKNIFQEFLQDILIETPDLVGFTLYQTNYHTVFYLINQIKKADPNIKIVLGGPEAFAQGTNLFENPNVDYVIKREGEEVFKELVEKKINLKDIKGIIYRENNNIVDTGERPLIKDLDLLPFPDFSDFNIKEYQNDIKTDTYASSFAFPIMGSRGCIGNCSYCYEKPFWSIHRQRSGENIFKEMKHNKEKYNISYFRFADSMINASLKELENLCNLIIDNNLEIKWDGMARLDKNMSPDLLKLMQKAGCQHLAYGLESGSQNVLNHMRKGIKIEEAQILIRYTKIAGINVHCNMIVGYPSETEEDFQETLNFLSKNKDYIDSVNLGGTCGIKNPSYLYLNKEKFGITFDNYGNWAMGENTILVRLNRLKRIKKFVEKLGIVITFIDETNIKKQEAIYSEEKQPHSTILSSSILIPVDKFYQSEFNLWPISYWQGDNLCKEGYTHVVARDFGFITYLFKAEGNIATKVKAKLSSHSKRLEPTPENASEITLLINEVEIETKLIHYYWPSCPTTEFQTSIPLKKGINTLTFKIKDTAKYKNGITIYYKSLTTKEETPITIEFFPENSDEGI